MEYLANSELKSLLTVTYEADRTFHLMILVSLCHALRATECLNLSVDDIDGSYLNVRALKGGICRLEPLHTSVDPLFDERALAIHAHGVRQQGKTKLFDISRATADRRMKRFCELAGIASKKAHWHSLRHSNAMMVFRETTSLGSVKQSLRHVSWSSSLVYLNESDSQKGFDAVRDGLFALISVSDTW